MASSRLLLLSLALIFLLLNTISSDAAFISDNKLGGGGGGGGGRIVGGRTKIKNPGTNKEVQAAARFAVLEYNRRIPKGDPANALRLLTFTQVVEAESQVVAGIKYYLKIAAIDGRGKRSMFDAVVVLPPGGKTKQLLSFTPSSGH